MHLVGRLDHGGMEKGVVNICNHLPADQFAARICTFEPGGNLNDQVNQDQVELMCVERRVARDMTMPWRLAKQMRREAHVEVLHTHNWATLADGIVAAKLAKIPILVHGEHGRVWDQFHQKIVQRWGWHRVHQFLTVSAELADRISAEIGFPREKIKVISNGVECDTFRPANAPKHVNRQRIGLPMDGFIVGSVGAVLFPLKIMPECCELLASFETLALMCIWHWLDRGPWKRTCTSWQESCRSRTTCISLGCYDR